MAYEKTFEKKPEKPGITHYIGGARPCNKNGDPVPMLTGFVSKIRKGEKDGRVWMKFTFGKKCEDGEYINGEIWLNDPIPLEERDRFELLTCNTIQVHKNVYNGRATDIITYTGAVIKRIPKRDEASRDAAGAHVFDSDPTALPF